MAERKVVLLRIRPELYDALQRWAHDEFRSVNGHFEYLLTDAVRRAGRETRPRQQLPETEQQGDERMERREPWKPGAPGDEGGAAPERDSE